MFQLGRLLDPKTHAATDARLEYDPADLTTHAVCVGMTGSGKTGLCVTLIEEAARAGIPGILIDPKGDITNLLLQFPELRPEDFQPWVNVDDARRAGLNVDAYAARVAGQWRDGLAGSGLGPEDIRQLKDAADWAIYTPGSDAGRSLSILKSLERPDLAWEDHQELLRERIAGICSGLLGLIGVQADPVKSREHILLANLFEHAWKAGQSLDLAGLIGQVQAPPFARLGVFEVDRFYPETDRLQLALSLNAIVAAPSFQAWITGEPLDIPGLFRTADGKPRMSILYVAHLSEAERMFFITLLLEQVVAWVRGQAGSTSLRGILYFDEVYGYFPPYPFNPPSKAPLMRLLKQARAFGLGVMLVTQNPGDLDYKGLTNTGTWFIGKLQTERDKARLMEGLETISAQSRATLNVASLDALIASLAPRQFLLNNVHASAPVLFHTRWAMSYLSGPLTRDQIRVFKPALAPAAADPGGRATMVSARTAASPAVPAAQLSLPASVPQYFLPASRSLEQAVGAWRAASGGQSPPLDLNGELLYRPVLFAQAAVRYIVAKADLNTDRRFAFHHPDPHEAAPHWGQHMAAPVPIASLGRTAPAGARLADAIPGGLTNPKRLAAWQKSLTTHLYRAADFTLHQNPALKLYSRPGQSFEEFRAECQAAAEARLTAEVQAVREKFDRRLDRLEDKLAEEQRELREDQEQLRSREEEARWASVENVVGLVLGRAPYRPLSTSASKERLVKRTRSDIEASRQTIAQLETQIGTLKAEAQKLFQASKDKWQAAAQDIRELRVTPKRSDILIEAFGLGWLPVWRVEAGGQTLELPAHE